MGEKGKAKRPKKNVKKRTELRKAERLNEEHEITITIVSEDENLTKKRSVINSAGIFPSPALKFRAIFLCPLIPSSR